MMKMYNQKLILKKAEEFQPVYEKISCSKECEEMARKFWEEDTLNLFESFYVLYLSKANKPIAWVNISHGGVAGTVVDAKLVFGHGLLSMASAMILFHNHPSGNLRPSDADKSLTKKMVEAGKVLDIIVLDHLILAPEKGFYSFADEGMI